MKWHVFIGVVAAMLSFQACSGQAHRSAASIMDAKGVVVLSNNYHKGDLVRFYNEDGSLWYEFTFYYDDTDGKFEFENENFAPFAFHPDYFVLALKCVGQYRDRYEVIVNERTGLRKFVEKGDPSIRFETWEEHIQKVFAVGFKLEKNPIREVPEGIEKNVSLPEGTTFYPVEVKEKWLKVRWDDPQNQGKNGASGWVKWRDSDRILIELYYFS